MFTVLRNTLSKKRKIEDYDYSNITQRFQGLLKKLKTEPTKPITEFEKTEILKISQKLFRIAKRWHHPEEHEISKISKMYKNASELFVDVASRQSNPDDKRELELFNTHQKNIEERFTSLMQLRIENMDTKETLQNNIIYS
tara:strand:- start:220 stop:642 length:423 start_codon:yes stop_codon:yes gene_type:complete